MSQLEVDKVIPQSGTTLTLGDSADTITIPSGATLDASSATLTLPDGTVTNAKVNASAAIDYSKLNLATSIVNADISTTAAIATTKLGAGAVLQVVQTVKTDTFTQASSNTFSDITGLSVSITPSSASSKILIMGKCAVGSDSGKYPMIKLLRDSTDIFIGDADGSRVRATSGSYSNSTDSAGFFYGMHDFAYNFLDSPSTTSATTYKIQLRSGDGGSSYINRTAQNDDNQFRSRGASSIIVMEISA